MIQKIILLISIFTLFTKTALAVPPPDFIINIGSQMVGVFSFIAALCAAIFTISFQFLKTAFYTHKKIMIAIAISLIFLVSLAGSLIYKDYKTSQIEEAFYNKPQKEISEKNENPINIEPQPELTPKEAKPISNTDFSKIETPFVLDARENIEYEYGNFPDSTHIRFADLKAGRWKELPTDQEIYVLCWSGMRGKDVAEYLGTKGLNALYLEEGADGWVSDGGKWNGEIKFSAVFPDSEYGITFTKKEVQNLIEKDSVVLVDARKDEEIINIISDYHIDLQQTSSQDLKVAFNKIPSKSKVITVCDEYTNCFMAKLVGIELTRRGHNFLGRFNQPWTW